ncbi:MAG: SOS response-associated peptidase [Anaerolineae bacterium]|nr:SOS response-associated peptidase [Anaerolineae bacterium]
MCGRFTLTVDANSIQTAFPWLGVPPQIQPRYNIAPSQPIAVVPNDGANKIDFFIWGLIPFWSKDPKIGSRMINARGETIGEKPSFKAAYKYRRCLILADGFYEWVKTAGQKTKTPHYIQLESQQPFALAGLWETWLAPDGSEVKTATIITTEPNPLVAKLHNRMPLILPEDSYDLWLSTEPKMPKELDHLIAPFPAEEMMHFPVSTTVNSPANESPACILPVQTLL